MNRENLLGKVAIATFGALLISHTAGHRMEETAFNVGTSIALSQSPTTTINSIVAVVYGHTCHIRTTQEASTAMKNDDHKALKVAIRENKLCYYVASAIAGNINSQ